MTRQSYLRRVALSIPVAVMFVAGIVFGCGSGDGGGSQPPEPPEVLSIAEALATKSGQYISVEGMLLATGAGADQKIVLASGLAESYPPQPGQPTLPLEGLDLRAIVGLTSTVGQPDVAPATWSDFSVVLSGVISDGVLKVDEVPEVFEDTAADARVRFSPVHEPIRAGDAVWWAFDVENTGSAPLRLTFSSGQRADVALSQNGVEKYRWSDGKFFTEAIETVTIEPGDMLPVVLNDTLNLAPGEYDFRASITAAIGDDTAGTGLPELTGRITVF